MENSLTAGDTAPSFTLPDSDGAGISLSNFKGQWLVLYFYPRDTTSGCTTEALDFTASAGEFKSLNARIIGVSPDSCASHGKFILKHNLGITLLSDTDKRVLKTYGAWGIKKMYGKESYGVVRSTFLIDGEGTIRHVWRKIRVSRPCGRGALHPP